MVEPGNFLEQYQVMSPRERNAEFGRLVRSTPDINIGLPTIAYDMMDEIRQNPNLLDKLEKQYHPQPVTDREKLAAVAGLFFLGIFENRQRRSDSEYKRVFMRRVGVLSQFANTTRALWEVVADELSQVYDRGIDDEEREHLRDWLTERSLGFPILLDPNYQDNGGAFSEDRNEVMEIERRYYHHSVRRWQLRVEDEEQSKKAMQESLERVLDDPKWQARFAEAEKKAKEAQEVGPVECEKEEKKGVVGASMEVIDMLLQRQEQEEALIHYVDSDEFRSKWRQEFIARYREEP